MASQDVEEIFKGVLTDESQESRESCGYSVPSQTAQVSSTSTPLVSPSPHPGQLHDPEFAPCSLLCIRTLLIHEFFLTF